MRFGDLQGDQRHARIDYVTERWKELAGWHREAGAQVATYLMAVNAGGTVAVLSFMGAMKTTTPVAQAPTMLLSFVLGLVLVGFGRIFAYYRVAKRFERWRHAVDRYYANEWTWEETTNYDAAMGASSIAVSAAAWASFGCFLVGCLLGIKALP